jgi:GNAT superfamily N-acetyltransferase
MPCNYAAGDLYFIEGCHMVEITLIERDMTTEEFNRMNAGFDENSIEHGVEIQDAERMGFVAMDRNTFIGCASGLAYTHGHSYSGWFYLTDLYVEKAYRLQGIGSRMLNALEQKIHKLGINKIWTWTAEYEGLDFYLSQNYIVFTEMENWYSSGHSRVGLRKTISSKNPL